MTRTAFICTVVSASGYVFLTRTNDFCLSAQA